MGIPGEEIEQRHEQETKKPKSFFVQIGHKISANVQKQKEQKHEKQLQQTIARIEQLSQSDDPKDLAELDGLREGDYSQRDLADDRLVNALLGSFKEFDDKLLEKYIDRGIDKEKIVGNEHIKGLAIPYFENLLKDEATIKRDDYFNGNYGFYHGETILQPFLEDIVNDEKIRKEIIENVGEDAIQECGDSIVRFLEYNKGTTKITDETKERIELLKKLGYSYFPEEDQEKREEKIEGLFCNGIKCRILVNMGFLNNDIVSELYELKTKRLQEASDNAPFIKIERDTLANQYYIPEWLEPKEDDENANFWREQDEKCGFDVRALIVAQTEDHIDREEVKNWLIGGEKTESLFSNCDAYSDPFYKEDPLYRIKRKYYRYNEAMPTDDENAMLKFYFNNLDRIKDRNVRGLIQNWGKIQCDTKEETEEARYEYLKYVARGTDSFNTVFNKEAGKNEETMLFNEDGTPNEEFYNFYRIRSFRPKHFLPAIDKDWQSHFTESELRGLELAEEYPHLWPEYLFTDHDADATSELMLKHFGAIKWLAEQKKKNPGTAAFLKTEELEECFDGDVPNRKFWKKALKEQQFEFLLKHLEEGKLELGLDPAAVQFLDTFNKSKRYFPRFMDQKTSYRDEDGNLIETDWTDNIQEYFDENGPKQSFWQKAFEEEERGFLAYQSKEIKQTFGFDAATMHYFDLYEKTAWKTPFILNIPLRRIPELFDENGPKPALWGEAFTKGDFLFLNSLPPEINQKIGFGGYPMQLVRAFDKNNKLNFPLDSSNIITALTEFLDFDADDWEGATEEDLKIREAFSENEAKDLALECMRKEYEKYLNSKEDTEYPIWIQKLAEYMHECDGAGPLVQIEAFLDFAGVLSSTGEKGKELMGVIEERMKKDHWDNQEKTNFYAVSAEVIQASPEIFHEFAELFANIKDKKDFEAFTQEIYPLYRAKLALLREYDYHGDTVGNGVSTANYNSVDKDALKNQLHNALLPFNLQELSPDKRQEGIEIVRQTILGEITGLFKEKLNIRPEAIPEHFDKASIKTIEDMTLYLSNIADPDPLKKNLIGLFLALQLDKNGGWEKLRSGGEIKAEDYMNIDDPVVLQNIQRALMESKENNPINQENTNIIDEGRLGEFRAALQKETSMVHVGNVQTIDQRLQDLIGNIDDLTDPDLYPDEIDKEKIIVLERYSPKTVGSVTAKMWQRANGKDVQFNSDEESVVADLTKLMQDQNLEITPENIKTYLQDGFNTIKIPFNIRRIVSDSRAVEAISELQKLLIPPDDIAKIFGTMGEEMKPKSGVLAVGADLDYLENLIVKHEDKLSEDELTSVRGYISKIRAKMGELEKIYDKITQNFEKYEKSIHGIEAEQLKTAVAEVSAIVHGTKTQTAATTTCTNDMKTIIENMRACLSCKTKGCNNDTDLTFGEGYKFYLYSKNGSSVEGSTADEVVYFVPEESSNGKTMSFVMDRIYGSKNSSTLVSHIDTMVKKAKELKGQFGEVPISIVIPSTTFISCNTIPSVEDLSIKLDTGLAIQEVPEIGLTVPKSGFCDHYVEFGNGSARHTTRTVTYGIKITV